MTANRPPRDITPARFFTDWLPREFGSVTLDFGELAKDSDQISRYPLCLTSSRASS